MANSDRDDSAAVPCGENHPVLPGRRQAKRAAAQPGTPLLELMVERGESYAANLDRANISYWETGARLAPKEFLLAFGRAFDIPKPEMARILDLAGHDDPNDANGSEAALTATPGASSPGSRVSGKTFAA